MKERLFAVIILINAIVINTAAQKTATVKSFTQTTDHIPGSDRRNDMSGTPCALVKVQVVDDVSRVEGNRIGNIVNKGVEKWVYMCKGSRNMRIHLKNHLPVRIMFQDYKIKGLESNRVYELVIETPDVPQPIDKQKLIINYTPSHAMVLIDSKPYKGNGRIEVELPVGEHSYTIAADGYGTAESSVKLNKELPREITEKLQKEDDGTSISEQVPTPKPTIERKSNVIVGVNSNLLTLKVKPFYAKITIDETSFEADGEGELTVPLEYGNHKIEVRAEGYSTAISNILIKSKKKETQKTIKLSKSKGDSHLKIKSGMFVMNDAGRIEVGKNGNILVINPKPTNSVTFYVDNIEYKPSINLKIKSLVFYLPYGTHEIKAECDGYERTSFSVNIGKSKVTKSLTLKKEKKGKKDNRTQSIINNGIIPGQNGNEVMVVVKPIYSKIDINGIKYSPDSKGRLSLNLPYGIQKVTVEADGYFSEQLSVNVGKRSVKKSVKLKRLPKKK